MKKFSVVLTGFLLPLFFYAQNPDIKGSVVDEETREKVPFATVAVYEVESRVPVNGTTTSLEGSFVLKNIPYGSYRLEVSFIGYNTREIPLQLTSGQHEIILDEISIRPMALQLEELEVTAMARSAVNRLDRVSYRAEDFETARGGTAAELLSRLPSLIVSPDGEISVRGTTDFIVYLNGRPTQIEPSMLLSQIPASSIIGIDIITVPTAGFDAQGKGGIINIVTKTDAMQGLSVSASGTFGGAPWGNRTDNISGDNLKDDRYGGALNIVYAKSDWVLQGGAEL